MADPMFYLDGLIAECRNIADGIYGEDEQRHIDDLMAELIGALQFAGLLEGCTGSEADLAQRLDEAVPAIGSESCRRIVAEAQRSAFGPDGPAPAGDGLQQAYRAACACVRARLGRLGRLSFRYLRNFD